MTIAEVAAPPLVSLYAALVMRLEDILITGKPQKNSRSANNGLRPQQVRKDKRFGIAEELRIGTWNVRGIAAKESELIKELEEMKVNISVITETKKKMKGTDQIGKHIMIYSGVTAKQRAAKGVATIVDEKWKTRIESYAFIDERILTTIFKIPRGQLVVIGVYAPEEGKKEETAEFYEKLQKEINIKTRI